MMRTRPPIPSSAATRFVRRHVLATVLASIGTSGASSCTLYAQSDDVPADSNGSSSTSGPDIPTDPSTTSADTSDSGDATPDECVGVYPPDDGRLEGSDAGWWASTITGVRELFAADDDTPVHRRAVETSTGDSSTSGTGSGDSSTGDTTTGDTDDATSDDTSDDDDSTTDTGGTDDCDQPDPPAYCVGSPAPEWQLKDYQPLSCGSGAVYGLSAFQGHVTLMALFKGW